MLYVNDIINKCNGKLLCGDIKLPLNNFSKDTRTINKGDVYIGIKGESFDGNNFYKDAFDKGASVCILDNISEEIPKEYKNKTIVKVDDTIKCIGILAKYKRSLYNIPVIAVTGSVGKTSTKEMIANVLSTKYKVLKTEANYNNHIGLPLTILKLTNEDILVVEMGMNNLGEISYLTDIAKPTIGVITNIGMAHIGNLGSRENILKAKLEITEGLSGPLIINNDNDMLHNNLEYIKSLCKVITIGITNKSDYMAKEIQDKTFKVEDNIIESPINNSAFIYNSLVAYVIGKIYNISIDKIKEGIKSMKLISNRLEYKHTNNGVTIIDDTYNSSLDAIKASLEILAKEKGKRKVAVIGDILEVGDYNEEVHRKIGEILLNNNLDIIITVGNNTKYTDTYLKEKGYHNLYHFNNEKESHKEIESILKSGDVVLFKASHSMQLGNIVKYLMQ